jgi:transposase
VAIYKTLDRATLERLYVIEGLSLKEVAGRLGPPATKRTVQRALQLHGIPLRPATPPARKQELMSRELLERLYVDEGRPIDEITEIVGLSRATVLARMRRLGIERRERSTRRVGDRQPLTRELLHELRVAQRLSAAEIGRRLGYTEGKVRSALTGHGMVYGQHRGTALDQLGPSELWWLHHHQQLPVREIAARLQTSAARVSTALHEFGIGVRHSRRRTVPPSRPARLAEPNLDRIDEVLAEAAARVPNSMHPQRPLDDADADDLRHLHHDLGLSLSEIGRRYNAAPQTVRRHFHRLGIEVLVRHGRRGANRWPKVSAERLTTLYKRADVLDALQDLGIPIRVPGQSIHPPLDLIRPRVERLYVGLGLPIGDVALLVDRSRTAVALALRQHGVELRRLVPQPQPRVGGRARPRFAAADVRQLAEDGLSADEIAYELGIPSATSVRIVAQVLQLGLAGESSPLPLSASVTAAVQAAGVTPEHAAAVLDPRHHGTGARRDIPAWPWPPDPALLRHLYEILDLGLVEIANRLRVKHEQTRSALRAAGIQLRHEQPTHTANRRWQFDSDELYRLSVIEDRTASQIAAHLGVSEAVALRALHRHHMPIAPHRGGDKRVRYDDLLKDKRAMQALDTHGIPLAGVDPPIRRTPLPAALLQTLLIDQRLTTFDVELLTGRLARAVWEDAAAADLEAPLLPPGVTADPWATRRKVPEPTRLSTVATVAQREVGRPE